MLLPTFKMKCKSPSPTGCHYGFAACPGLHLASAEAIMFSRH